MKYLFYLLPGLLDVVVGLFMFIAPKRIADAGASSIAATATLPVWAVVYTLTAFSLTKFLKRTNAAGILLASQIIMFFAMAGMLFAPGLYVQYFWLMLCGLGTGLFFPAFQTLVKLLEREEVSAATFTKSTATYTFSWSMGMALGPTVAAFLWGAVDPANGWRWCYVVNLAIIALVFLALIAMVRVVRDRMTNPPPETFSGQAAGAAAEKHPNLMLPAWILGGGGLLAISVLRAYFPDYATKVLHLTTSAQGVILGLISYAQAFTALACGRTKSWPYHPWTGMAGAAGGIISLTLFAFGGTAVLCAVAAVLFGVFSGIFSFNITFHALANADRSARYASINETITGAASLIAPLGAGLLADHTNALMPFVIAVVIVAAALGGHFILTWKTRNH